MTYRRKDARYRQAKTEGYRARSAYKLIDLDRRFRLLRPGTVVVDLGAWPGGWLQVATERVGPTGRVVGVDLVPIDPLPYPQVETLQGDIRDATLLAQVRERLGRAADVVLSDAAPKLTGVRARDEAQCDELSDAILGALPALLSRGGAFVMKTFMRNDAALRGRVTPSFDRCQLARPPSSRQGSSECYLVAAGFRGDCG